MKGREHTGRGYSINGNRNTVFIHQLVALLWTSFLHQNPQQKGPTYGYILKDLRNTYSKLTSLPLVRIHAWTCDSVKVKIQFHLECKPLFLCAQVMLQQIVHLMNVHYLKVSTFNKCEYGLRKLPLELVILCSHCWFKIKVTARQEKKPYSISSVR